MIILTINSLESPDDQNYFKELYQEYKRLMFATAGKYVSNISDQEDIVQSALEKLIQKNSILRPMNRCTLAAYIVYTIRSIAVDLLRKESRTSANVISVEEYIATGMELTDTSLIDYADTMEMSEQLKELWTRLPEEDKILLEGKYIWERTDQELAKILHCKASSIRMKLTRARRRALNHLPERK